MMGDKADTISLFDWQDVEEAKIRAMDEDKVKDLAVDYGRALIAIQQMIILIMPDLAEGRDMSLTEAIALLICKAQRKRE